MRNGKTAVTASTRTWRVLGCMCLAWAVSALGAQAREGDERRDLETAEKKAHALLREAEELQEAGKREKAQALRQEAELIRAELRQHASRGDRERRERDSEEARRGRVNQELEQEIEAAERQIHALMREAVELDEAGKRDRAAAVRARAEELRARLRQYSARREGEHREGREREGEHREGRERERSELRRDREGEHREGRERDRERDRERPERDRDLRGVLEGLEHGMAALKKLGRHDEAARLQRIANDVRQDFRGREGRQGDREDRERRGDEREGERPARGERERPGSERQVAVQQLEVLRMALPALREAGRGDAAEFVQRAIRAREVGLEGRRDDEAHQIRERAPSREQLVEALSNAAKAWRELGNEDKAHAVGRLAEQMARPRDRDRERPAREREGERPRTEREAAQHQIEIMVVAVKALSEAGREDSAELLERAIRARKVALEGRRDDEAHQIRERSPSLGGQIELLMLAGKILRESNKPDRAELVGNLAEKLQARHNRDR